MKSGPKATALRVLIVDDSSHFLNAARDLLELGGIRIVATASTGAEALRLTSELDLDGVLVDVDLGDESGLDLARALAAAEAPPVVLISAYPEAEFADLIASTPAVGFLSKSRLSAPAVARLLGIGARSA
jgi:DNA-binding NarL/FixJ family response regulator